MDKEKLFAQIKGGLIVSCQALETEPLYTKEGGVMPLMAKAAAMSGAVGIRANTVRDITQIKQVVDLPVIGIIKKDYPGTPMYITVTMKEVDELVECGVDILAVQGTGALHGKDVHAALHQLVHFLHGNGDVHGRAGVVLFDDADDRQIHHLFDLGDVPHGVGTDAHSTAHGGGFRHQRHHAALFRVQGLCLQRLTGDDQTALDLSKQLFLIHRSILHPNLYNSLAHAHTAVLYKAGFVQLCGEEQHKASLTQCTGHDTGAVLKTAVAGKIADLPAGVRGKAPALTAGDIELQVSILFVIFRVVAIVRMERGIHRVDKNFLAIHLGAAQRQAGRVVGQQVINGRVEIFAKALVARQVLQGITDHKTSLQKQAPALPSEKRRRGALLQFYSFAMAASIMACASATMASSSGIRPGMGSRTPPSSRPYIRRRISFCTAYRLPWASHIL